MYVSLWVTDKAYCFFPIWPFGRLLRTAIMQFTNMSVCSWLVPPMVVSTDTEDGRTCILSGSLTSTTGLEYRVDGTSDLTSLSERTWRSYHLQIEKQRQQLLNYFKTLSVGLARARNLWLRWGGIMTNHGWFLANFLYCSPWVVSRIPLCHGLFTIKFQRYSKDVS